MRASTRQALKISLRGRERGGRGEECVKVGAVCSCRYGSMCVTEE